MRYLPFWTFLVFSNLFATTIEEKISSMTGGAFAKIDGEKKSETIATLDINTKLSQLRKKLHENYRLAEKYAEENSNESAFQELLREVNRQRNEIATIESEWRQNQVDEMIRESEEYGVWEQEEVTLSRLIVEYGARDYLYVIPSEVAGIKVHLHTSLQIPRESWSPLLDGILKYNGVGVKDLNPYTKQLYLLKQDLIAVNAILSEKFQLEAFDDKTRVVFIYSPETENLKAAFYFLERFRDPKSTFVYQVGQKIAVVGFKEDVKRLVCLADKVWESDHQKVTKVITTFKIQPEEIIKILKSYFGGLADSSRSVMGLKGGNDLSVLPLTREGGVVLIGSKAVVEKAEEIVRQTELQIDDPFELTVFWYTCSHTNPTDLAEILEKVYNSLIYSGIEGEGGKGDDLSLSLPEMGLTGEPMPPPPGDGGPRYPPPPPEAGMPFPPAPPMLSGSGEKSQTKSKPYNFIPYTTTGSVLMVVRKDTLGKIKEVIKKLDIPKRMVEIEVLLCERRVSNNSRSGINLLKLGSVASNKDVLGATFENSSHGIFEFIFSQTAKHSKIPLPFDLAYNFLLTQEDIRVSQSPSVITINQSPVTFSITDQISINTGVTPITAESGVLSKESYERIEYGITLTLTPTVHEPEMDDPSGELFVTLENDIAFENLKGAQRSDRPDVHKRRIKNQVRILDGQTIILGGLKSKSAEEKGDAIPFLGEIPGLGKLFGSSALSDSATEMFIFIKPKVIHDPKEDLIRIREELLTRRPGDLDFLTEKIAEARKRTQAKKFSRSLNLFFETGTDDKTSFIQ